MFKEFKRPMWNDGWSSIRSWNNLYNDYELNHCCFGDGGDGDGSDGTTSDPSQAPDYTGLEDVQGNVSASQAAAAAAAEAAAAADPDMGFDQQSLENAIDYAERQGSFGYDDLVGIGYFDRKAELDRQSYAQDELDAIANLSAMGLGVDVQIDPRTGEYSYEAPSFAEAAQAAGMGFGKGVGDLASLARDAYMGMSGLTPLGFARDIVMGAPNTPGGGLRSLAGREETFVDPQSYLGLGIQGFGLGDPYAKTDFMSKAYSDLGISDAIDSVVDSVKDTIGIEAAEKVAEETQNITTMEELNDYMNATFGSELAEGLREDQI